MVTSGDGTETMIVHAGKYGEEMDTVDLTIIDGVVTETVIERYTISEDMADDKAITAFVSPYYTKYTESLSEGIGYTTVPLDVRKQTLRTEETNAGDWVTDTVRRTVPGVDMVLINAGSIRGGDRIIPAGELSYLTLNEMFPYENMIVTVQMTGREITETLEWSASALSVSGDGCPGADRVPSGGFMQVSGLQFAVNTTADTRCIDAETGKITAAGERIENLSVVTAAGPVPIDREQTYTVAVTDYISNGGDGYTILERIPDDRKFNTEMNLIDLVADEIEKQSPVSPKTDGRIRVVE
ncbi:5'-nucleotidase C-terminal domain-containing protein [Methanogenium cariaci]|uniref:5'-nucleotidase C-terminal domain-containing protein n=1 Tax=Methanogenium cariaci TaxID=2197 RepID=UPI001FE1FDC2|nr:5'-nucleotidase [Methanogenium cariaci]